MAAPKGRGGGRRQTYNRDSKGRFKAGGGRPGGGKGWRTHDPDAEAGAGRDDEVGEGRLANASGGGPNAEARAEQRRASRAAKAGPKAATTKPTAKAKPASTKKKAAKKTRGARRRKAVKTQAVQGAQRADRAADKAATSAARKITRRFLRWFKKEPLF